MKNTVVVYEGSTGQPVEDQIVINGRAFDLTGATVKFKMRYAELDDLKVDEDADIVEASEGTVKYDWTDPDVDTPGEYFGWWNIEEGGNSFDTEEFLVLIAEHAPGQRTKTGAIARATRSVIPVTWDALQKAEEYGDSLLQDKIEIIKLRVFGSIVTVDDEITYDIRIINFIAKLSAIEIIPGAVDYWMNQHQTVTTQGTQEMVSYTDRIDALWKVYERLVADVASERATIEALLGVTQIMPNTHTPAFSEGKEEGFKTPLSSDFFDYSFPDTRDTW